MENSQNEAPQSNTSPTPNTPQNNTSSDNGKSNPKRSWIRRHPILTVILVIFGIIFLLITVSGIIGTIKSEKRKGAIENIEKFCNDGDVASCVYLCNDDSLNEDACNKACLLGNDLDACNAYCAAHEFSEACDKRVKLNEEEAYKKSPRGICESNCNKVYTKNSETWRLCITGCKDMRNH